MGIDGENVQFQTNVIIKPYTVIQLGNAWFGQQIYITTVEEIEDSKLLYTGRLVTNSPSKNYLDRNLFRDGVFIAIL